MKAVVQRVASAAITLNGETLASIGQGLFILVGVDRYDKDSDIEPVIKRILNGKLFEDEQGGLWKRTLADIDGEILCASQFTLFAHFKGSKPDFHESMEPVRGKELYEAFVEACRKGYRAEKVQAGKFGSTIQISLINDGPTTILFDTQQPAKSTSASANQSGASTPNHAAEQQKKADEIKAAKALRKAQHEANKAQNAAKKEQKDKEWAERSRKDQAGEQGVQADLENGVEGLKLEETAPPSA